MKNFLFFSLGAIITLIIIILIPPSIIKFNITSSVSELITAFATIAAVIVALSISIWGKTLRNIFYKPNITIVDKLENIQNKQAYTRLLFLNKGNATAKNVEVYVTKIFDNEVLRMGFLPVPLLWTHSGFIQRNFHPHQFGYLDLIKIDDLLNPGLYSKLVLLAGSGVEKYEAIYQDTKRLELTTFEGSGIIKTYSLILEYTKPVKISSIVETQLSHFPVNM